MALYTKKKYTIWQAIFEDFSKSQHHKKNEEKYFCGSITLVCPPESPGSKEQRARLTEVG